MRQRALRHVNLRSPSKPTCSSFPAIIGPRAACPHWRIGRFKSCRAVSGLCRVVRPVAIRRRYNNEYYCTPSPTLDRLLRLMRKKPILYPGEVPFAARGQSLLTTNSETVGEGRNRFRPDRSRRSFRPESLPLSIPYDLHRFSQHLSPRRSRWPTPHWLLVLPSEPDHDRDPRPRRLRLAPARRRTLAQRRAHAHPAAHGAQG